MAEQEQNGIESELFEHPKNFSYFQTINLLRRFHRQAVGDAETESDFLDKRLRVDGYLSLAFPPNDVVDLEVSAPPDAPAAARPRLPAFSPDEKITVTATFMGLYGSASPLPTFYTEELMDDEREDLSASKSFMDLLGQLFFVRYYQALGKYRLLDRVAEEGDKRVEARLRCLFGVGHPELLGDRTLRDRDLSCNGLFVLRQRSASGLASYLAERFDLRLDQVAVEQCTPSWMNVPVDQRAMLGRRSATLGEDAVLGSRVRDRMGQFRVAIRDLDSDAYHAFLPGRPGWDELRWAIRFYAGEALRFEVRLGLRSLDAEPARLSGNGWRELGGDAFLGVGTGSEGRELAGCRFG